MGLSLELESTAPLDLTVVRRALEAEADEPKLAFVEHPGLLEVAVHPACEPLTIAVRGERTLLSAKTGTAGAGMHAWVCDLAERLGQRTNVAFDVKKAHDPSGFAQTRDTERLLEFQAAFLAQVAAQILELMRSGHSAIALGMPDDLIFEGMGDGGVLATPLGPRDRAWLERVAKDGRRGFDALPWAMPGVGADMLRGMALSACWTEVRYRPPMDESERALLQRVLHLFERAYALDPEGPFDFSLWSELFELSGEESLRATRTHLKAEKRRQRSTVGYRRHPVTVQIGGGWRIRIPGELKTEWESGGQVWAAWDAKRSLHVSTVTAASRAPSTEATLEALIRHDVAEGSAEGETAGQTMLLKRGAIRGQATVRRAPPDGSGRAAHQIRALSAVGPHGALGTFLVEDEAGQTWALETWGTLDHEDARDFRPS